jgi:transketolase
VEVLGIRETYGEVLLELGRSDNRIVALDADLSGSTMTKLFAKEFPDRFFNMGVSEQDMIGTAAGLALSGKIPFVSSFAIFATGRVWEQIRQAVAYPKLNVKIVASHGGICVGEDGASHQSLEDVSLMRVIPHMTVIVPADGIELRSIIKTALDTPGPFYIRSSRMKFPIIYPNGTSFRIGRGDILSEGTDVTVIAAGLMVSEALKAADLLKVEGISARVVNMSSIKPIDVDLIVDSARKTGAIVTAEEHSTVGALGGAVCEVLAENHPVPVRMLGVRDRFGTSGTGAELLAHYGLNAANIVMLAKDLLSKK